MNTIDTRGLLCPTPLIMTKRAITASNVGDRIEVLSDNDTAKCNLLDYIKELGYEAECANDNGTFRITFSIDTQATLSMDRHSDTQIFCATPQESKRGDYVVVLKSEFMGDGERELGAMLMRACINSLSELDSLPATIVIYNSGVMLAVTGTDTAESLKKLSDRGIEIIVCGTCVDYYNVKDQLAVGTISNMYRINTILSQTNHVVYP